MKAKISKSYMILISLLTAVAAAVSISGCGNQFSSVAETTTQSGTTQAATSAETTQAASTAAQTKRLAESDITIKDTISNSDDGAHAITADGEEASYSNILVTKTGEADGDEADFYGENAAIFATNGGTLNLSEMVVKTDGKHANAVFSYGEGTIVNISDSYINTTGTARAV